MTETQDIAETPDQTMDTLPIAMDRMMRSFDHDNRLRVALTPISKANVCPYRGVEIPRWRQLGLDPDKEYMMFRDPKELEKAAKTSDGIPLLDEHRPVTPDDHETNLVAGATGTDAVFDGTYLKNSLVVWKRPAIDLIMTDAKKELSCAYSYDADMTPGLFGNAAYDGVMRNIKFNHVALVVEGRAGPDVLVADAMPLDLTQSGENRMARANLSQDAKARDEDFEDKAKDKAADELDDTKAEDEDDDEDKESEKKSDDKKAKDKRAKDKRAADEDDDDDKDKKASDEDDDDEDDKKKASDSKRAMDKAILAATIAVERKLKQDFRDLHEAEELVRPYVGGFAHAMDSAQDVYAAFFKAEDIDVSDVDKSGWRGLAKAHIALKAKSQSQTKSMATDSKRPSYSKAVATKFPEVASVKFATIYR